MSSHLTTGFNRLAKLFGKKDRPDENVPPSIIPNRTNFIQTEALPPYIDRLYTKLRPPREGNAPKPDTFSFLGLFGMAAIDSPNKYVESFGRMHPQKAKERLMREGPLLENPNLSHLPERERKVAEMTLASLLYYLGMSREEHEFFSAYMNGCQPDAAFIADENLNIATITDAILSDRENAYRISHMTPRRSHRAREAMPRQYYLRLRFMQEVADQIAIANHHPFIPVILDELPEAFNHIGGWAINKNTVAHKIPATDVIVINASERTLDSVSTMINYIGHEMRHIMDRRLSNQAIYSGLSTRDPNRIHAGLVALNEAAYINSPRGPESQYDDKMRAQLELYRNQYMERAARNFGEKLEKGLMKSLPSIFDPSPEFTKMLAHSVY